MKNLHILIKNNAFLIGFFFVFLLIIIYFCVYSTNSTFEFDDSNQIIDNTTSSDILLIKKPSFDILSDDLSVENDSSYEEVQNDFDYSSMNDSDTIATLTIPSLNIDYPVLASSSTELLKISLNKFWGCNPNQVGNFCVVGHNYKNGKFFSNLPSIKNGDIVKLTDLSGNTIDYSVYDTYIVDPEDTACTSQLTDGNVEMTLVTCYYVNNEAHASKRFVVKTRAV